MSVRMDPDFLAHMAANPHLAPSATGPAADVLEQRARMEAFITKAAQSGFGSDLPPSIRETKHTVTSYDGADITVYEYSNVVAEGDRGEKKKKTTGEPAILYIHGGGGVSCPIDPVCRPIIARFASDTGVRTFGVEYRYAPEHPHPTPVEDCYAALRWLASSEAADGPGGIDPARIGICGESAGGLVGAGLALLARDRGHSPPLAKQILLYPMLDDRSSKRHLNPDSALHRSMKNWIRGMDLCWDAYLGGDRAGGVHAEADADVSFYGAPARATDLRGLPPTYMDIGGLDWFRDETLEFAARLAKADVDVELHLYTGVPHGFDFVAPEMPVSKNAKENRFRAVRSL